ncbi:hypothetical protein ACSSS7_001584 [Eimeria intestinalis]
MTEQKNRFKLLLRNAEADLAKLTRAACTLRTAAAAGAGAVATDNSDLFSLQQQQQQQQRWGRSSSSSSSSSSANDSPLSGSTAADTATSNSNSSSNSSSSSSNLEELYELRHRVAANLDAAESILNSLRFTGSSSGAKTAAAAAGAAGAAGAGAGAGAGAAGSAAAAAGGVGRAQLRHFSDLLLSARSELAHVSASLEATLERERLLGGPLPSRERGAKGDRCLPASLLLQNEEEREAAALDKERKGLLHANNTIQNLIGSGASALQQLRSQRVRQQRQQQLLLFLHAATTGVRGLIRGVRRVRYRDKAVLGCVLGCCFVFTFLWFAKVKPIL